MSPEPTQERRSRGTEGAKGDRKKKVLKQIAESEGEPPGAQSSAAAPKKNAIARAVRVLPSKTVTHQKSVVVGKVKGGRGIESLEK